MLGSNGRYVDDAGDLDAPEGVSYADWEREQAVNVEIPACAHFWEPSSAHSYCARK